MLSSFYHQAALPPIVSSDPVWAVILLERGRISEISKDYGTDEISDRPGHVVILPATIWLEEACRHVCRIGKRIFDFTAYNALLPSTLPLTIVTATAERNISAADLRGTPAGVSYLRLLDLDQPLACHDVMPRYRQLD